MKILIELKRQFSVLFSVLIFNPDIIYVDRANILSGSICARFLKKSSFKNYGYLSINVGNAKQ